MLGAQTVVPDSRDRPAAKFAKGLESCAEEKMGATWRHLLDSSGPGD